MLLDPINILKAIIGEGLLLAAIVGWIQLSHQLRVSRSLRNSYAIAVRLTFVYVTSWFLFCGVLALSVNWFLMFVLILFLLSLAATLESKAGLIDVLMADPIGLVIFCVLLLPVYVMKQLVLGFPERDFVVLSPPDLRKSESLEQRTEVFELDRRLFKVVATLRPTGKIESDGQRFDAVSFDGTMIDAGQLVQVCDQVRGMYVVRPVESDELTGTSNGLPFG